MSLNKKTRVLKRRSTIRSLLTVMLLVLTNLTSSECQGQQDLPQEPPQELLAFAHLSYFSNRGFMLSMLTNRIEARHQREIEEIPVEVRQFFRQRENNLLTTRRNIDWLPDIDENKRDLPATLERLSRFGMIELFYHQNSRLLDRPLEIRKELMDHLNEIASRMAVLHAGLIGNKDLDEETLIVLFGNMRRFSVDFDLAILSALSQDERSRVTQLISVAMPDSIEMIRQTNCDLGPFGFGKEK